MTYLQTIKTTWYKTIAIDTLLFLSVFSFLYLIRTLIMNILENIQHATPELALLQQGIEQAQTPENIARLETIVSSLNTQTELALLLGVLVLPLGLYVLWTFFHALHFSVLQNKKITLKLTGKYFAYTVPFFIVAVLIILRLITLLAPLQENNVSIMSAELIAYPIIVFLLFSILLVSYAYLPEQTMKQTFLHANKTFFTKIYYMLPLLLLLLVFYLLTIYYFFQTYITKISLGTFTFSIGILIGILLLGLGRTFLVVMLTRNHQKNH